MARAVKRISIEVNFEGFVPVQVVNQVEVTVKALMESQQIKADLSVDFDYEVRSNLTNGELQVLNGINPD